MAAPVLADDWDFVLVNRTGKAIKTVELAPTGTAKWQANQLEPARERNPIIGGGARLIVHLDNGPGCDYDVKATFPRRHQRVWANIDVCGNAHVTVSVNAAGAPTFRVN